LAHRQICAVLFCMLFMSLACAAPDAPPRYELSIRMGLPLEKALQELARQTGMQIIFFSKITNGRGAPELSGEYTLAAALARLLEGSDLTFRPLNEHTVEVLQAPPHSAPVPRKAQPASTPASDDPLQEVTVIATAEQLVATRVPTPLEEIPQSISVISREQIREQNSVDLGDVMENTPGIAVLKTNSLDVADYSRAFQVTSYHVDGGSALKPMVNLYNLYQGDPDMSEFDHVEVLRGSDALFSSNSSPGGTVSLVRKVPLLDPTFAMSETLGSWNNYRIELDATGALTDDGALRARADVVYAMRDYFFDQAHLNRKKAFAVVEYDFTPRSTLTVGGSYQWDDALPLFSSIPTYSNGSDAHLPRSTSLTFPWAFYNTRIGQTYFQYRQQLAGDWILKLNTSVGRTILDYGYGTFGANSINTVSHSLSFPNAEFSTRPADDTLGTMDATLTGKLDWFGMRERIAIGGDFMRVRSRQDEEDYFAFGPPLTNVLAFDPQMYPDPRSTMPPSLVGNSRLVLEQFGGFVSLQVDVNHGWSLSGGARVASDRFRDNISVGSGGNLLGAASIDWSSSHVVQPYGALMYGINDHLSWYASYADIYLTQEGMVVQSNGAPLGPQHGVTFESGIKGAWRKGKLNGYLAVYRVEQRDVPVPTEEPSNNPLCCYASAAGRSRGAELGLDGELAPGWLIGSGYAYNLYATGTGDFPAEPTPRHLLKIWTSARLSGGLARWTIGGSLRAQTAAPGAPVDYCKAQFQNCVLGTDVTMWQYAVLDLRAGYQLSRDWQVALSVNNVFDKRYYLSQDTPSLALWYGEPRNFMLRIDAKY
jgi:outer-membrane receptor for ferric coprogen and ferric-rhodotorulic acid